MMVVEDDRHTRRINTLALSSAGYEVVEALDGAEAIHVARERSPDLIVMDLALAGTGGLEATRRIKAEMGSRAPLVLVLTAHALNEDARAAQAAGCDAFMAKPIDPFDLVEEVGRLIASRGART